MRMIGIGAGVALAGLTLASCAGMGRGVADRSALVAEPTACAPKRFEVYFDEGQARLTSSARQAIGLTATQLQDCAIRRVQVVGLASASGDTEANQRLSEQRATAVAEALTAAGWPAPAFEVEAVGDQGAATASGSREPLRRRTEVLVDAVPR